MNIRTMVKGLLTDREDRRYEKLLQDKMVSYQDWVTALEQDGHVDVCEAGGGVNAERFDGQGVTGKFCETIQDSCNYVVIRSGEGRFASGFCGYVQSYFAAHPEVSILYGDEDVGNGGQGEFDIAASERRLPWFKPDWSPDLLESTFYFGSVVVLRAELFRRAVGEPGQEVSLDKLQKTAQFTSFAKRDKNVGQGMAFYVVTDFAAYEVWMHRLVELAGGYEPGSRVVGHVAMPWFAGSCPEDRNKYLETSPFLRKRQEMLLQTFRNRNGHTGSGSTATFPVVSIVILSKDHPEILEKCLKGCALGAKGQEGAGFSYEVILVDNGSSVENRRQVEALIQEFTLAGCRITYLYRPQTFHFSRLCNLGAAQAAGKLLLFLNDDVVLCQPGCVEVLAALAERPWTGAVGMKLYYPDSVRIQHAGITNLPMGPVHKLQFLEDDKSYYYGANRGRHNVLAVTAACLMVEREKYLQAGGFAEELPVAFNDVDFGFRLYELGYQNVCVNDRYAYHYESLSRGDDESPEKLARLLQERDKLYERHPALEGVDPYYSLHLNREGLDVAIRPAYLTAGNIVQKVRGQLAAFSMKGYRTDACLMVRVEDCRNRKAVGYGVVLGDNNACYEKMLLMERVPVGEGVPSVGKTSVLDSDGFLSGGEDFASDEKTAPCKSVKAESLEVYAIRLEGQYRPDLEENMPDQVNVGLCGFMVDVAKGAVPEGRYRLGMGARNRVTGLRIVNWSNRMLEL